MKLGVKMRSAIVATVAWLIVGTGFFYARAISERVEGREALLRNCFRLNNECGWANIPIDKTSILQEKASLAVVVAVMAWIVLGICRAAYLWIIAGRDRVSS